MIWELEKYGENIALLDDKGRFMTYRQLSEEGEQLAESIHSGSAGENRCLAFCFCRNCLESVLGYTAMIEHGVVPALLSAQMDESLIRQLLQIYQPSYLWLPEELEVRFYEEAFPEGEEVYEYGDYRLLRMKERNEIGMYEKLALLLTTSGSTGSPKFVRQSYENILDNARSIACYLELDETERPVTTLPMNYTYGLSIINSHLLVGATVLLTEKGMMQKEFWNFMKEEKATSFGGVPYTYEMLDKLRFERMDLPHLRTMTQAGGKLLPSLHEKFARYAIENGKHFVVMYGQCEATARMAYLPYEKSLEKYGSMGIAIPGGHFSLIDVDGKVITEPEVTGELIYEGKNVTLGYACDRADLLKGDERHGRLETGDMAKRDEDGYYYIVGRKKRFLKIYGNRVNLDEMDRMVKEAFPGLECASAGKDDHLIVFVTDDAKKEEILHYVSEKTGLNPKAFSVKKIPEIPKNDAGKIQYKELENYYDSGRDS
ncbi:MAG: AMP-binding protein [Clostridiales bacterium]|nr:AMP-binding protein [Clostridiales bacterium]